MTIQSPLPAEAVPAFGRLPLSDADFVAIAALVHSDFGLHLPANKKELVMSRLGQRVRALGLNSFSNYVSLLNGPDGEREMRALRSLLTTNVTRFFREDHQFTHLRNSVLPDLVARARAGERIRLWSAGCSAGQEPYSLALCILELCPEAPDLDILILGTDIDPEILRQAQHGVYPAEERAAIPMPMQKHLVLHAGDQKGSFAIGDRPRALVRLAELNLMRDWPMRGRMDVIFCRNVVIYFTAADQASLWQRFSAALVSGGHLFIGHSERMTGPATDDFERLGNNLFCRRPVATGSVTQQKEMRQWR